MGYGTFDQLTSDIIEVCREHLKAAVEHALSGDLEGDRFKKHAEALIDEKIESLKNACFSVELRKWLYEKREIEVFEKRVKRILRTERNHALRMALKMYEIKKETPCPEYNFEDELTNVVKL